MNTSQEDIAMQMVLKMDKDARKGRRMREGKDERREG